MDTSNNHLMNMESVEYLLADRRAEFDVVPLHLQNAAKKKLNGRNSAFVSKDSGGKLSKWAAQERKKKRQAQKASRKANR